MNRPVAFVPLALRSLGILQSTPLLQQLIEARTKDTLTLTTRITLEVRPDRFGGFAA